MKNNNKKGFTLAELLIVVAIIGVLVAISIPIFNKQIEKSREAYDIATMRQAASLAVEYYYSGVVTENGTTSTDLGFNNNSDTERRNAYGAYDPKSGKFVPSKNSLKAYGKGTKTDGGTYFYGGNSREAYSSTQDYRDAVVMIAIYPAAKEPHICVFWKNNQGTYTGQNNSYVGGRYENKDDDPKYCIWISLNG
ncbi:MAG: prepilin-type N-terminal cleavage/methylation domain-containing protein [Solobacterium sp.]|nr:prepilin-type N-terminal cleavage/methylation domain-containing protein [Solobacterium sp.]